MSQKKILVISNLVIHVVFIVFGRRLRAVVVAADWAAAGDSVPIGQSLAATSWTAGAAPRGILARTLSH